MSAAAGPWLSTAEAYRLVESGPEWLQLVRRLEESPSWHRRKAVSFSRNITIPVTRICRNHCHYCSFRESAREVRDQFLSPPQIRDLLRKGAEWDCREALFLLGERPEEAAPELRAVLADWGCRDVVDYLVRMAATALEHGMLAHTNAGVLDCGELDRLRRVNISMGLMLESTSRRLGSRGGPHEQSPGKRPEARLRTIRDAGRLGIPFTTGILVGIGETPRDRVAALLAIRGLHRRYGHIQEVIVQKFCPKPGTPMAEAPEPSDKQMLGTVALARLILGPDMNIQAPVNLIAGRHGDYLRAGANDWGGVSPVTRDEINPEHEWPGLHHLVSATEEAGFEARERLAIYPEFLRAGRFHPDLAGPARALGDGEGYARMRHVA